MSDPSAERPRYALYYAPRAEEALAIVASRWLAARTRARRGTSPRSGAFPVSGCPNWSRIRGCTASTAP